MRRIVIVLLGLWGSGLALGQVVITSTEIIGALETDSLLDATGQVMPFDNGAVSVTYNVGTLRQQALAIYDADVRVGCNVYDAYLFGCFEIRHRELWYGYKGRAFIVATCETEGHLAGSDTYNSSGNNWVNRFYSCRASSQVLDNMLPLRAHGFSYSDSWEMTAHPWTFAPAGGNGDLCAGAGMPDCSGSWQGWNVHVPGAIRAGLNHGLPSVEDLVNDFGFSISGVYIDGGYGEGPGVDPGEPGGGGDTVIVEPGNCEDGWILTRAVCIIRDQGERLWTFISHDAWVPDTGYGVRIEALRQAAAGKAPIGYFVEIVDPLTDGGFGWSWDNHAPCPLGGRGPDDARLPDQEFRISLLPGQSAWDIPVPGLCFDDVVVFEWWNEHGRMWIWWLALAVVPIGVIRQAMK